MAEFKPYPYQAEAIGRAMKHKSIGLFLDMGLGKTVITLTAISNLITLEKAHRVLVIAPLQTARNTWPDEKEKWDHTRHLRMSLVLGTAKQRLAALNEDADIYVINRENVEWLVDYITGSLEKASNRPVESFFDTLVIDELSSFKNPSAKRFKALRRVLPLFKRVIGLTGTPASNGYLDLWSEIYLLDRGERLERTVTKYRNLYFKPGRRNAQIIYEWVLRPEAKIVIDKKLSDLCMSMKASDYIEMPDKVESDVFVTMDSKERKLYDRFGREHVLPEANVVGLTAASVQNKLLQMANGFVYDEDGKSHLFHEKKLDALSELKEAANRPMLVFYSFIEDKKRILERFPDAVELKGRTEVENWNKGEIPMLVTHPASAGHGLNLQHGGDIIVWYGLPWSLELYQQANARLYRQGQKKTVSIYRILTRDTHDSDVLKALEQKNITQEELLRALKARLSGWTKT